MIFAVLTLCLCADADPAEVLRIYEASRQAHIRSLESEQRHAGRGSREHSRLAKQLSTARSTTRPCIPIIHKVEVGAMGEFSPVARTVDRVIDEKNVVFRIGSKKNPHSVYYCVRGLDTSKLTDGQSVPIRGVFWSKGTTQIDGRTMALLELFYLQGFLLENHPAYQKTKAETKPPRATKQ